MQEMLAPREVRFYSAGWKFLGTRSDLKDLISSITEIPVAILKGGEFQPHARSIGEVLSWASMRETSIEGDMAYSLLGLLDVNMPLLYGEGHKSFLWLQEELLRRYDDESIFAWEAPPRDALTKPYFSLLSPSVNFFHGSHRFRRSRIQTRMSEPTTFTNKGISIRLPLIRSDQGADIFYALLNSHIEGTSEGEIQPAIKVQCLGGKQYARLDVHHLHDFNFANHIGSQRNVWRYSSHSDRQMLFPYQPQSPLPITGIAVHLPITAVYGGPSPVRIRAVDSVPRERWKYFGSDYAVLGIENRAPRRPDLSSSQAVEDELLSVLSIELVSKEFPAVGYGRSTAWTMLSFGLDKPGGDPSKTVEGRSA